MDWGHSPVIAILRSTDQVKQMPIDCLKRSTDQVKQMPIDCLKPLAAGEQAMTCLFLICLEILPADVKLSLVLSLFWWFHKKSNVRNLNLQESSPSMQLAEIQIQQKRAATSFPHLQFSTSMPPRGNILWGT